MKNSERVAYRNNDVENDPEVIAARRELVYAQQNVDNAIARARMRQEQK